jgi:TRAP-type C4-dicarboxylate transport system substrate-binding protein
MPGTRRTILFSLSLLTLALAPAACGGGSNDKAGGAHHAPPVVIHLADFGDSERAQLYVNEVARRSHGTLRIVVDPDWRHGQRAREAGLIRDVKAGKVDVGWAATRGFDDVGVTVFDALHAPLLVDSLPLEEKVLRSGLVAQMLHGLEPLGVVGLGIVPGPLRRPLGLARPLVTPDDYRGATIGLVSSRVGAATLNALGATPRVVPAGTPIGRYRLDGLESNLGVIEGNGFDHGARELTSNVALWARPEVLFINERSYARLTAAQQRVLREAGTAVLEPALASLRGEEKHAAEVLCERGLSLGAASDADVSALRDAVRPVFASFDARTDAFVGQIRAMAHGLPAEPAPTCAPDAQAGVPRLGQPTPLDGRYSMHVRREQAVPPGGGRPVDENYGESRYVLDRGRFHMTQKGGRSDRFTRGVYVIDGDRLTLTVHESGGVIPNGADEKPGEVFAYRWSRYRNRLTLRPVDPQPGGYPPLLWTRTGDVR